MRGKRGFTLIELLAITACLVLLIVIVLYAVVAAQERARIVQCAANLRAIGQACSGYANNYRGWYPLHGAKDTNTFTADVSPFTGGSGYWFGDATFQGTDRYQDVAPENSRYAYAGIAQLLVNAGSYRSKGAYNVDGMYLTDWRTFYCPNQLETTFFSSFNRTYNVLDPNNPYDSSTSTDNVIGTVSGGSIVTYYSIPAKQRQASQMPEIGYCATNGNSPGYTTPSYSITGANAGRNKMWRYQGKYVYDSTGTLFAGKDATGNERFAAGFITDPPDTIIMADVALCNVSGTTMTLAFAERGRSDYLSFSHDTGINTVYNDGRVVYLPLKSQNLSTSTVYYGNSKGATVFGAR